MNIVIKIYDIDMLDSIVASKGKMKVVVNDKEYTIKTKSNKFRLFKDNLKCTVCGVEGCNVFLEQDNNLINTNRAFFSVYGIKNKDYVLLTRDHKIPRSKKGADIFSNLQTMCSICNFEKKNN